jgi:transposase
MVKGDLWYEIHSRFKLKESKKSIARNLGLCIQTIRKVLRQEKPKPYERLAVADSILKPFTPYVGERLAAVGYCAQAIFEELRERGYTGSYETIKRYVHPLREEALQEASVRFETPPGRQAQVDWGQAWTVIAGRRAKAHLYVMTLGYSRRMYGAGMADEKLPSFIQCHLDAFDHFGGCVQEIVYDNAKTTVLSRDFEGRKILWNPTFWDFCRYYGFRAWAHRPYRAQTKGKVESGVKYVKRFLRGKSFESLEHLNNALMAWIVNVADQRIHGTTHRKPAEMFAEERDLLCDHRRRPPYVIQNRAVRQVAKDCLVTFETNRYSVPFRYVGRQVEVQNELDEIRIYHAGQLIGLHPRLAGSHEMRIEEAHYAGLWDRQRVAQVPEEVQVRDLSFYESLVEEGIQ